MGTVFQIPWTVTDLDTALIPALHEAGFETVAMALTENSVTPDCVALKKAGKLAIVLGTEGDGLPKDVIAECDYRVMIPMYHGVDSLNVAAASAVIFWEMAKQASPGQ